MSIRQQDFPEFAQAIRGYDRLQVDGYLERLREYAVEVEDRALGAEAALGQAEQELAELRRQLAASGGGELPARLEHILALATEEADEIRNRATAEAEELARRSHAAFEESRNRARAEAERTLADAVTYRETMDRQVAELEQARSHLLDRLTDLSNEISNAVGRQREIAAPSQPTQRMDRDGVRQIARQGARNGTKG
jgi:cell division septum initiation protein DivIVA